MNWGIAENLEKTKIMEKNHDRLIPSNTYFAFNKCIKKFVCQFVYLEFGKKIINGFSNPSPYNHNHIDNTAFNIDKVKQNVLRYKKRTCHPN